jgi:hypothetical protein
MLSRKYLRGEGVGVYSITKIISNWRSWKIIVLVRLSVVSEGDNEIDVF